MTANKKRVSGIGGRDLCLSVVRRHFGVETEEVA